MSLKLEVKNRLEELDMLDVMVKFASHTGKFSSVEIQIKNEKNDDWVTEIGYKITNKMIRVIEYYPVSLIKSRSTCFVAKTEHGHFFCNESDFKSGYISKNIINKHKSEKTILINPATGY